jgi:ParB family chromosome partitioning protein
MAQLIAPWSEALAMHDEALATTAGTTEVEWARLEEPYAHLRVRDACAESRLASSLAEQGQRTAVLVVVRAPAHYALIDGYRRVRALRRLGHDTATALVLGIAEPDALAYCHTLETGRRRSALEDGWLIRELVEARAHELERVAMLLGRSKGWVSRRLGLVRALPPTVQEAVRRGLLPPHAAAMSLLPLSRGNRAQCERLVERLGNERISTRQAQALYAAWKRGDGEQRQRIVDAPHLFLSAIAAAPPAVPVEPEDPIRHLVRDLDAASNASWRARESFRRAQAHDVAVGRDARVLRAWRLAIAAHEGLRDRLEEKDDEGS